jgi:hypothetical protein
LHTSKEKLILYMWDYLGYLDKTLVSWFLDIKRDSLYKCPKELNSLRGTLFFLRTWNISQYLEHGNNRMISEKHVMRYLQQFKACRLLWYRNNVYTIYNMGGISSKNGDKI